MLASADMRHIDHISLNKANLDARWALIKAMREFFWSHGFTEVETPQLVRLPGQEPYLDPMQVQVRNEQKNTYSGYLHTSPEYTMKKMLAAGYKNIFSMCKTFRDVESFGGTHNPEFTMLEWYRTGVDFYTIMEDVAQLMHALRKDASDMAIERIHMRDLWKETIDIDLDDCLETQTMHQLCIDKGYTPKQDEPYEDLFYRIFLNEIEPSLKDRGAIIIHHYPAQMAALSKLSEEDNRYAERFELYINGIEIANAFTELTNAAEQKKRLVEEQKRREQLGKDVYNIDNAFLEAVEAMPPSAGIALGVDRLVQVLLGTENINDILPLPASVLWEDT